MNIIHNIILYAYESILASMQTTLASIITNLVVVRARMHNMHTRVVCIALTYKVHVHKRKRVYSKTRNTIHTTRVAS